MEEDLIVTRGDGRTRRRSCGNGARPGRMALWRIQESRNPGLPVFVHDGSVEKGTRNGIMPVYSLEGRIWKAQEPLT